MDGSERYRADADFSSLSQRLSIFQGEGSVVKVKSVKVETQANSANSTPVDAVATNAGPGSDRSLVENGWTILFRSKDPLVWNLDVRNSDSYAIPMSAAPDRFRYVRMRRMDTKDEVILEQHTFKAESWPPQKRWFRGDKPVDRQACALGIIDTQKRINRNDAPVVDVRPDGDAGGWGFGVWEAGQAHQGYIWNNQSIDPTVIEIAVTERGLKPEERKHLLAP